MTSEDVDIVRSSFAKLFFDRERVGLLFYRRLFEIAPETRKMFKSDVEEQARKLMDTLGVSLSALRDTPTLEATLKALGRRHVGYGVKPEHFKPVGEALIYALDKSLGADFDDRVLMAWTSLYGAVAATMMNAAIPVADAA